MDRQRPPPSRASTTRSRTPSASQPQPPPILIGGDGERFLLRAVAEHGDWWLPFGRSPEVMRQKIAVLKDHCTAVGRNYDDIRKTFSLRVNLAKTKAEAEKLTGGKPMRPEDPSFVGEPAALIEYIHQFAELGIDLFQLVFPKFPATDDIELFERSAPGLSLALPPGGVAPTRRNGPRATSYTRLGAGKERKQWQNRALQPAADPQRHPPALPPASASASSTPRQASPPWRHCATT
ncbi:MAG: LLM class flavin-dependent oxidoreductase [Chloroflexia bacterium]